MARVLNYPIYPKKQSRLPGNMEYPFFDVYINRKGFSFNTFSLREQKGWMDPGNKQEEALKFFTISLKLSSALSAAADFI